MLVPGNQTDITPFSLDFYLTLEPKLDGKRRKEKRVEFVGIERLHNE
jgi:hypothetical protein